VSIATKVVARRNILEKEENDGKIEPKKRMNHWKNNGREEYIVFLY
jgi:hypothetical protein